MQLFTTDPDLENLAGIRGQGIVSRGGGRGGDDGEIIDLCSRGLTLFDESHLCRVHTYTDQWTQALASFRCLPKWSHTSVVILT